jgi:hypothetical protein
MITRKLNEPEDEPAKTNQNGLVGQTKDNNKNAAK